MLVKHRFTLGQATVLEEPILRHEDLADSLRAPQILEEARRQGHQILNEFRTQALDEQAKALADFWTCANQYLANLEEQRQMLQLQAVGAVEALLTSTLSHLLDETTLEERVFALARNLSASQPTQSIATLSCHPDMLAALRQWLTESRFSEYWQLKSDTSMPAYSLRLGDANGAFDIEWSQLRRGLLGVQDSP